jgi:hypothetical protein
MTPGEWAEVFNAGAASYMRAGNELVNALSAMEMACKEIADRQWRKERAGEWHTPEGMIMGKYISEITPEEAVEFRKVFAPWSDEKSKYCVHILDSIIRRGSPDRPESIAIIPPTIIEGGQAHGRP